jgi:hypothetical protein
LKNGYFFVSLSFSVVGASIQPKLCIISQPLATCDEDYFKLDFSPKVTLETYKLFYHPFVRKYLPNLAESKINNSYITMIEALYKVKLGTFIVSDPDLCDKTIKDTRIRLFVLLKQPKIFRHFILMKLNLIQIYKKAIWIINVSLELMRELYHLLKSL